MDFKSAPFVLAIILKSCIFACGEPQGTLASPSTASQTAAVSTTTATSSNGLPTSTSTPDEIYDLIDITLDGKIFPPSIVPSIATM